MQKNKPLKLRTRKDLRARKKTENQNETPKKNETNNSEGESPKAGVETPTVEQPKGESPKAGVETPTVEQPKGGSPKAGVETPTVEQPKGESPKAGVETPTVEQPKGGSPKAGVETPTVEQPKGESPKAGVETPTNDVNNAADSVNTVEASGTAEGGTSQIVNSAKKENIEINEDSIKEYLSQLPDDIQTEVSSLIDAGTKDGLKCSFGVNEGGTKVLNMEPSEDKFKQNLIDFYKGQHQNRPNLQKCYTDIIEKEQFECPKYSIDLSDPEKYNESVDEMLRYASTILDADKKSIGKALKQKLSQDKNLAKEVFKEIHGEETFNNIPADKIDTEIESFIKSLST